MLREDLQEKRKLKVALRKLFHNVLLELQDAEPTPLRQPEDPTAIWEAAWAGSSSS